MSERKGKGKKPRRTSKDVAENINPVLNAALDVGLHKLRGVHNPDFGYVHWSELLKVAPAYLNNVRRGFQPLGAEVAKRVAASLGEAPEKWLILIGLLDPKPADPLKERFLTIWEGNLSPFNKHLAIDYLEFLHERQLKEEAQTSLDPIIIGNGNPDSSHSEAA